MKLRTFTIWGWQRWLIYGGGALLMWVASLLLIFAQTTDYTRTARLWSLLAPLTWMGISWWLYVLRSRYAARIAWVDIIGISVVPGDAWAWLVSRRKQLDEAIRDVVAFWAGNLGGGAITVSRIVEHLNGMALQVAVSDEPIEDRRHGVRAKGLTYPSHIDVQLTPTEMAGGPGSFWAVVRHEFGHACLDAMGMPPELQHQAMKDAGWRDA